MATITIDIPDGQLQRLQDLARVHRVSPEALISANLEGWLSSPSPEFVDAAKYVLRKNAELYQRPSLTKTPKVSLDDPLLNVIGSLESPSLSTVQIEAELYFS